MLYSQSGRKTVLKEKCLHPWMKPMSISTTAEKYTENGTEKARTKSRCLFGCDFGAVYRERRYFKDYKNTNSKHRANAGSMSATQFTSDED